MWYQIFKHGVFRPYVRAVMRPQLLGEENIPARGGAILACNHLSAADTFMLPASIGRKLVFPAKAELFRGNRGPSSKAVAWFLKSVGQVPMDRAGGKASAQGLGPVLEVLRNGELVAIFPEGTRSPDGRLYKGKTGVARLALESGVPVIPVGMVSTDLTRGLVGQPTVDHAHILIGKPLDFSEFQGRETDQKTLRQVTDRVMAAIQELTGQVYVDVYGSRVKHGDLSGSDVSDRIRETPISPEGQQS